MKLDTYICIWLAFAGLVAVLLAILVFLEMKYKLHTNKLKVDQAAPNEFQRSIVLEKVYTNDSSHELGGRGGRATLRILSWNIERGHHPAEIARYIESLQPDIACLQEVDWGNKRTGSIDVLDDLAQRTHLLGFYGVEFLEITSPYRLPNMEGGGVTGNALLTRIKPVTTFRAELPVCLDWEHDGRVPQLPTRVRKRIRREKRVGRRFALCAEFLFDGKPLVVSSVHLEDKMGGVAGRYSQFMSVVYEIQRRYGDAAISVIAGDFNTFDCSLARALYSSDGEANALGKPKGMDESQWWRQELLPRCGYVDPFDSSDWTFQVTSLFKRKLDWIAVRGGRVVSFGVGPFSSSDHRPLWINLTTDLPKALERDPDEGTTRPGAGREPVSE